MERPWWICRATATLSPPQRATWQGMMRDSLEREPLELVFVLVDGDRADQANLQMLAWLQSNDAYQIATARQGEAPRAGAAPTAGLRLPVGGGDVMGARQGHWIDRSISREQPAHGLNQRRVISQKMSHWNNTASDPPPGSLCRCIGRDIRSTGHLMTRLLCHPTPHALSRCDGWFLLRAAVGDLSALPARTKVARVDSGRDPGNRRTALGLPRSTAPIRDSACFERQLPTCC